MLAIRARCRESIPRRAKHWHWATPVRTIQPQSPAPQPVRPAARPFRAIGNRFAMTPLVPERMLVFSPALAATIGLEEAILLHLLHDLASARAPGTVWLEVELEVLQRLLPFWSQRDLQRVSRSLADKGVLRMDSAPLSDTQPLRVAFDEPAAAPAPRRANPPPRPGATPLRPRGASSLSSLWQPDEDLLQLLALNHGIPRQFALDQLEDFTLYWRETGQVSHAWASRFRQHVLRQWRLQQQQVQVREEPAAAANNALDRNWQPSVDALQILERGGVSRDFIEDAIPEFVLYWRERGEGSGTWNSKFIAHIRRQWARYANALEHDQEPRPLAPNWQPSEDVYDILRMANIDLPFARELLPEFILFWRDAGTAQRSWNTKFLQHIKYQWATRHHMQAVGGARQLAAGALEPPRSTFDQLTDRSWAAGLVDGI